MYTVYCVTQPKDWVMGKGFTLSQAERWKKHLESKGTGDTYIIVREN